MARQKLTDEERAQRRDARLEREREKRAEKAREQEQLKTAIRGEIIALASVIPPHVREAGVHTVRTWKDALDKALNAHDRALISVERLQAARDALKTAIRV
ncbi:hypothetical protein [Burkholderia vietnamiensis]|uniref:hypothetical protein n=1 Tax=Burkholderia vietnamiensis TaxID=60552 RepID=UPI000761FDB6|nr:hypothetical protein [Burkholderia vietnamiensis]MCA7985255.1 hypothetical protein [Burkholderia vietnamiensis]HDR8933004.1 hypothetical protein [Burkholderia vietnamiensis]